MSKVYLVGAGPGDPDLITWKGRKVLQQATSVLYDHLANEALLQLAPPSAERLYVGKKRSEHAYSQQEICGLLIDRARRGGAVVRLKGGDPFIFGRGGEELEALADAGIPFEVVPGVTAPLGIAAYSGVPLTHRDHTSVVTFVTGHNVDSIDWSKVGAAETLVIFMGLASIHEISQAIVRCGRDPQTPAMAVRWGTRPIQQTVVATLGTIAAEIDRAGLKPPATIVIGDVVSLRGRLNWFENLPLFGQRIAVTRARSQSPELADKLHALGAEVLEFPTISLVAPQDPKPLAEAIQNLDVYDWLIFTSANGVKFFTAALDESTRDLRHLKAKLCAIGPATARALTDLHLKVDLMPAEYVAEALAQAFAQIDLGNQRILIPRAAIARDVLPGELRARGAHVDVVEAYRNIPPVPAPAWRPADWITFTSSSTVDNFVALAPAAALDKVRVASIGPITTATARKHGIHVDVQAADYTMDGLVEALLTTNNP